MLLKIVIYIVLLPIIYLITRELLRSKKKIFLVSVSISISILLTILVIFVLNEPSYIKPNEIDLLRNWGPANKSYVSNGYLFIKDHFIIVDNSYDKQLIEKADIAGNGCNIVITDRNKLIKFFKFLNQHINSIDLVICDISFTDPTPNDTILKHEMDQIYLKKKLLVSNYEQNGFNNVLKFEPSIQGAIKEVTNDKRFVSHKIQNGDYQSLAYKIYAFHNKIQSTDSYVWNNIIKETDSANKNHWLINSFIPRFSLTDESKLIGEENLKNSLAYADSELERVSYNWVTLGTAADIEGQRDLLLNLQQRKNNGQSNYIFLGVFKSQDEDVHNTIYKPLHGTTILLNIFNDLNNGKNRIGIGSLVILVIGFFIIFYILISLAIKKHTNPQKEGYNKNYKIHDIVLLPLKFIFQKEIHYVLLVLLFFIMAVFTGIIINILYLAIYIILFEGSVKYFAKNMMIKPAKKLHEK